MRENIDPLFLPVPKIFILQLILRRLTAALSIHRKMPMPEFLFDKAAGLYACNFIKMRLQHRCFPVNIAKFLRSAFL